VRKRKGQSLTGILIVDVHLSSAFPIIGRAYILNNRTIGIRNLPHFLLSNLWEAVDEAVDVSSVFHFLSFSSLFL
jgi:hypothetical protein